MNYRKPDQVTSPKDCISNIRVLYDGGEKSFSIARLEWEGDDCFAIRWNVAKREWNDPEKQNEKKQCVGMPSSHGYSVWFVIPDEIIDSTSHIWNIINNEITRDKT